MSHSCRQNSNLCPIVILIEVFRDWLEKNHLCVKRQRGNCDGRNWTLPHLMSSTSISRI